MAFTPDTSVLDLSGIGEQRAKKLEKLGITRAGDLLAHYPRDYEERSTPAAPGFEKAWNWSR